MSVYPLSRTEPQLKRGANWLLPLALVAVSATLFVPVGSAQEQASDGGAAASEEATIDFQELTSPVSYTEASISRGRVLYVRYCTECHGPDGKALVDVLADASDLTTPEYWYNGSREGEVYRSISEGAGVSMPPYKFQISDEEDLWHLVNFVRSLWPVSKRPQLVEQGGR